MSDESRPPPAPAEAPAPVDGAVRLDAAKDGGAVSTASASIALAPTIEATSAEPARPTLAESDVMFVAGKTQDGDVAVIRSRFGHMEAGVLAPLREGQPLHGEVVSLKPRPEHPRLCDVKVEVPRLSTAKPAGTQAADTARADAPRAETPRKGPPKVSTDAYRQNWDHIWAHGAVREHKPN